jgi:hypothetical protein
MMNHLPKLANSIDIQRIAGIKRVLGIDLTDELVRIVELENLGSGANKYAAKFYSIKASYHRFKEGSSLEQKVQDTRECIASCGFSTRYAISSIRTLGIRTIVATLPTATESIGEWIQENYERLIGFSLPISQLSFGYEVIESTETETRLEVTFVKNSDMAWYRDFFEKAGLTLLSLGAATRDAANGFIVEGSKDFSLAFVDSSMISVTRFSYGARQATQQIPISDDQSALDTLNKFHQDSNHSSTPLYIAGEISPELENTELSLNGPLGLRSEETLAAGLAVKGFLPEISPINFLTSGDKENVSRLIYKSLTHRAAIILGTVLMLLLSLQLVASWIIQNKIETAEQRLSAAGPEYTRMSVLQRDVDFLRRKFEGANPARSHLAKTLHDLASATPENVWLYRLQLVNDNRSAQTYLKKLRSICREASLVRSSLPLQSETMVPVRRTKDPMITFEAKALGME